MDTNNLSIHTQGIPGDASNKALDIEYKVYTYADLIAYFKQHDGQNLGEQQLRQRLSTLTKFLDFLDKISGDKVGSEMGGDFMPTLGQYVDACENERKSKGTIDNYKTQLKQWQAAWVAFRSTEIAPKFNAYYQALQHYLNSAIAMDHTINMVKASVQAGLDRYYISTVIHHQVNTLTRKHLNKITKLEEILGAPPTAFTSFAFPETESLTSLAANKTCSTEAGRAQAKAAISLYKLRSNDLNERLKNEIKDLVRFKTAPTVSPMKRNKPWRLQENKKFSRKLSNLDLCSPDGKRFTAAGDKANDSLRSFFGCLVQLGYDSTKFSLAYLADFDLLKKYLEFMEERRGMITKTPMYVFTLSQSLLLKERGYLRQKSGFASLLPTPIPESKWDKWCEEQRELSVEATSDLNKGRQVKQGRDPKEPIKEILEMEKPVHALFELVSNMQHHYEEKGRFMNYYNKAVFQRDILLFQILTEQPLRIKMCRDMQYYPDNSGNIYKRSTGVWAIKFKPEDFKNETGAAQKEYDVPLSAELWPLIEHYIDNVRPIFEIDSSDFFLIKNGRGKIGRAKAGEYKTESLSERILIRSRQFLKTCPGFGPQSIRHIIATDYIKNNPDGFQVAADVLHDTLQTVIDNYAHLTTADGHKFFASYLVKSKSMWKGAA